MTGYQIGQDVEAVDLDDGSVRRAVVCAHHGKYVEVTYYDDGTSDVFDLVDEGFRFADNQRHIQLKPATAAGEGDGPPHWKRISGQRQELTEQVAGFPCYELALFPGMRPRPYKLTARAHGRYAVERFKTGDEARAWARDNYAKGPG